jgi:transcriptional regulator with XRE-family HTH domain
VTPAVRQIITQITALRMAKGWTQETTSASAGLYVGYLSEIERLLKSPLADTLDNLAGLFGLTLTIAPDQWLLIDTAAELGPTLRRLRLEAGLTLSDLTAATGILETNLSAYEHGRRYPDPVRLHAVVAALGCRLAIVGAS